MKKDDIEALERYMHEQRYIARLMIEFKERGNLEIFKRNTGKWEVI
jgi:hypothetical protein